MQNNLRDTRCNLCGTSQYRIVYKNPQSGASGQKARAHYAISDSHPEKPDLIVRCTNCGFTYALGSSPLPRIKQDYKEMIDLNYLDEEVGRRKQARLVLSHFRRKRGARLLDVGCGPGFFLDEAKKSGWDVQGLDLSSWAVNHCKDTFHINVFQGTLLEASFPDRHFDVVVMIDVVEHVPDPMAYLEKIRRILKNDGILYISTPDISSSLSRILGARWWGINKYHLCYFSKKTLLDIFHRVGFKLLRHYAFPRIFSLRYWASRTSDYPFIVHAPFYLASKIRYFAGRLLKINLFDQISVVASKVRRLDTLEPSAEVDVEATATAEIADGINKVIAVLPAYNAEKTLRRTVADIPKRDVDEILLVDDASADDTVRISKQLGLRTYQHKSTLGYGANQKTCYDKAIELGADIVVMVHPDYQYDPTMIPKLLAPIKARRADAVFGSRLMRGGALEGGMPLWKHNANILLTAFENIMLGTYLTEYHSGFRAYSVAALKEIDYHANSNAFLFDTEIIVQLVASNFRIEEIPIRTRYFEEASSIKLWPSIVYGLGILWVMLKYRFRSR